MCEICGYNKCIEALDFHHRDPSKKDFTISSTRKGGKGVGSWPELKKELDKCILVCSNCHREIHAAGKKYDVFIKEWAGNSVR